MSGTDKPGLRPANENPWYCLATLHGEQPIDWLHQELAAKNYTAWNHWINTDPGDHQRRAETSNLFANRTSLKLPKTGDNPDFSHTHFERNVNFTHFEFPWPTDFRSVIFSSKANFSRAQLFNVNFSSATFSGRADFQSTVLSGPDFRDATFSSPTYFNSATFAGTVDFFDTTFSDWANFDRATFADTADFQAAVFLGLASFGWTKFSDKADFGAATFSSYVDFINANFAGNTIFADARFESKVPDFRGATHEATEWHGVAWPKPPWKQVAQEQVYAYERLKQEMERLKKHEDEQSFFRRELRARRGLVRALSGGWLLNLAYQASSDYGNSVGRPLLWLFGVFAAGMAIFTQVPLCAGQPMPLKLAARLGFANIFVFLPDKREILAMPEMATCLSNWTATVSAAQSLLGVVLLFLLGLALRNRFRMK